MQPNEALGRAGLIGKFTLIKSGYGMGTRFSALIGAIVPV